MRIVLHHLLTWSDKKRPIHYLYFSTETLPCLCLKFEWNWVGSRTLGPKIRPNFETNRSSSFFSGWFFSNHGRWLEKNVFFCPLNTGYTSQYLMGRKKQIGLLCVTGKLSGVGKSPESTKSFGHPLFILVCLAWSQQENSLFDTQNQSGWTLENDVKMSIHRCMGV